MRLEARALLVVVVAGLALGVAGAEEPDPTQVQRLPAPVPVLAPTFPYTGERRCDEDSRCRLEHWKADQARRHRREYLRQIDAGAREMDKRIDKKQAWRTRYNLEANLVVVSNLMLPGGQIGYAPLWWIKIEGYLGYYEHRSVMKLPSGNHDTRVKAAVFGTQIRFLAVRWMLHPYAAVGWSYLGGGVDDYFYDDMTFNGTRRLGPGEAHIAHLGLGVELVVPYFHAAIGYQFGHAIYTQAYTGTGMEKTQEPTIKEGLQSNLDDNHHGVCFEIGAAF